MGEKSLRADEKIRVFFVFACTAWLFFGCGDSNLFEGLGDDGTQQAKFEAAKMAVDQKDYTSAIDILVGLCGTIPDAPTCDSPTVSLLASAYMGRAGVDMLQLIKDAETAGSWPCTYTLFSKLFQHSLTQLSSDQSDLLKSLALLNSLPSRTSEEGFQLAIGGISELVVELGLISSGYNSAGKPINPPSSPAGVPAGTVTQVSLDLGYIQTGLTESGLSAQSIGSTLNQVLTNFGTVTSNSLFVFLQALNATSC